MSTLLRVQVELPSDTSIPSDGAMNVWHFWVEDTESTNMGLALAALETFYLAVDTYLSSTLTGAMNVKVYDLKDPTPRVPIFEETNTLTPGTGSLIPTEVAVCLSHSGAPVAGENQARRRGRIFLGPVHDTMCQNTGGSVFVNSTARTAIAAAADALMDAGDGATFQWVVFSPTTAGPLPWDENTLEAASTPVEQGYIDNAFDTQRRRGPDASARTNWP